MQSVTASKSWYGLGAPPTALPAPRSPGSAPPANRISSTLSITAQIGTEVCHVGNISYEGRLRVQEHPGISFGESYRVKTAAKKP
jgi:hypothetical protein